MGTGVGEAMLISAATGAAVGGASAAMTGGDPLKGALLGGVTGGAGAGLGGALGGAAAGTASGAAGGTAAGTGAGGMFGGMGGLGTSAAGAMGAGAGGTFSGLGGLGTSAAGAMGGAGAAGAGGSGMLAGMGGANTFAGAQLPSAGVSGGALGAAPAATVPEVGLMDIFSPGEGLGNMPLSERAGNYLVQNPMSTGMTAGSIGAMMAGSGGDGMPDDEEYDGPLRKFRYGPSTYRPAFASGGGIAEIPLRGKMGTFSDGGQLVEGPGDGMSDDIPAVIGEAQPARLTDGEFVVPADVVSGLGNGSTDAGARALYEMMDRVRKARTGSTEQAAEINPQEVMGFADGGSVAAPAVSAPAYSIPYRTADSVGELSKYSMGSSGNGLLASGGAGDYGYWGSNGQWVDQNNMPYNPALVQAYIDQRIGSLQQSQQEQAQQEQAQMQQQREQLAQLPGYAAQRDYTSMARPGYQEFGPSGQFYQPIYQPEYEDMSVSKSDADYYNQKLAQLQRTGSTHDGIDWSQADAGDLRNYFESLGLTPQQHWEQWGREEGLYRPIPSGVGPKQKYSPGYDVRNPFSGPDVRRG